MTAGRPLIAITSGEPAGIGPEICLRLLERQTLPVQLVVPGGRQPAPRVRAFIDDAVARLPELAPIGTG